ncbi:dTDP-4-dehydrorhamnose reductase [Dyadobacter sp.]|uniref:dTDP-4-dehydrorhamnose reductase n=1 Tax=Dyadobacter sp. TaxID=1914288 RepID=UPI003F703F2D
MKILILGASGQLGSCLRKVADERNLTEVSFPSEQDANILSEDMLTKLFETENPTYVVNCAAYTAVDKAEDDQDLCRKVNRDGARNIARLCKQYDSTLIHISTDFVFKGDIPKLLSEDDLTTPENIYGLTKLEGEGAISEILPEHFIIRTSWLYSEYGSNFVKTMLRLAQDRSELGVIVDQVGSPTYGIDLANAILDIAESGSREYGIYHYSNEGAVSWYDFAKAVFDLSGTTIKVNAVKTSEYVTRASRPAYSVMDKTKIKRTFSLHVPYWRDSLDQCIKHLI